MSGLGLGLSLGLGAHRKVGDAWTPKDITGLVGWFDASGLALNNNDSVSTWSNLVVGNGDITQSTAIRQPKFLTNQQNGLPVVRFGMPTDDDTNADTMTSGVFGITSAYTFVIAGVFEAKLGAGTNNRAGIVRTSGGSVQLLNYVEHTEYLNSYLDGRVIPGPSIKLDSPCAVTAHFDGTSFSLAVGVTFIDAVTVDATIGGTINWGSQETTRYLLGSMFEICVFNKALTTGTSSEHAMLLAYLTDKWGL